MKFLEGLKSRIVLVVLVVLVGSVLAGFASIISRQSIVQYLYDKLEAEQLTSEQVVNYDKWTIFKNQLAYGEEYIDGIVIDSLKSFNKFTTTYEGYTVYIAKEYNDKSSDLYFLVEDTNNNDLILVDKDNMNNMNIDIVNAITCHMFEVGLAIGDDFNKTSDIAKYTSIALIGLAAVIVVVVKVYTHKSNKLAFSVVNGKVDGSLELTFKNDDVTVICASFKGITRYVVYKEHHGKVKPLQYEVVSNLNKSKIYKHYK